MKPAPANHTLAIAAALCAVVLLGACKTTTSEWRRGEIGTEWEKRTMSKATAAMEQINAAASGDDTAGYMANEFDMGRSIQNKSSRFGKKYAKEKSFRTKEFAGVDEYKSGSYHFQKRQDFDAKSSPDQELRFADGTTESPDAKKNSFWQRKRADTKDFGDGKKAFNANGYRDTDRESERLGRTDLNIVEDGASEDGATMTVDDVRDILHGSES